MQQFLMIAILIVGFVGWISFTMIAGGMAWKLGKTLLATLIVVSCILVPIAVTCAFLFMTALHLELAALFLSFYVLPLSGVTFAFVWIVGLAFASRSSRGIIQSDLG